MRVQSGGFEGSKVGILRSTNFTSLLISLLLLSISDYLYQKAKQIVANCIELVLD